MALYLVELEESKPREGRIDGSNDHLAGYRSLAVGWRQPLEAQKQQRHDITRTRTIVVGWACVDGRVKSCISDTSKYGRRAYFSSQCAKTHSNLRFSGVCTSLTHVETCANVQKFKVICFYMLLCCGGTYFTHVQTCDNVRVQSATQWTASAHTLHMSKPVITFVFKVLRNGLLRYILYTCPNLW